MIEKSLKSKAKSCKVADGTIGGLHVTVSPTGKHVLDLDRILRVKSSFYQLELTRCCLWLMPVKLH